MNKPLLMVVSLCLSALVVNVAYASSSISTRVKVVEDKVRVHDKKIKDIKAQQEELSRNLASTAKTAHSDPAPAASANGAKSATAPSEKPTVREKSSAELRQERAASAAQAKRRAEAEARAKHERLAALYRSRYAYP